RRDLGWILSTLSCFYTTAPYVWTKKRSCDRRRESTGGGGKWCCDESWKSCEMVCSTRRHGYRCGCCTSLFFRSNCDSNRYRTVLCRNASSGCFLVTSRGSRLAERRPHWKCRNGR